MGDTRDESADTSGATEPETTASDETTAHRETAAETPPTAADDTASPPALADDDPDAATDTETPSRDENAPASPAGDGATAPTLAAESEAPQKPPRAGLIAAGVLIVVTLFVAAIVLGAMWFTGGWSGPSSDDPAESVDDFLTALLENHDEQEANSYLCQSVSGNIASAMGVLDNDSAASMLSWSDVKQESVKGDTAVVTAKVAFEATGQSSTWTFAVVTGDPDNAWRVCGIDTGSESES